MVIAAAAEIGAGHGAMVISLALEILLGTAWARNGTAQSKTPTSRSALNYSKLLFLFGNFGCEGRI
jgi:hypothetical protein